MKASVNGTLIVRLIHVPVGVCAAVSRTKEPSFRTLHAACSSPVKVKRGATVSSGSELRWCETCDQEAVDVVYGFEYSKNQFVLFTEEERAALTPERSPVIEVQKFVPAAELKPAMMDSHYFLEPNSPAPTVRDYYGLVYQAVAKHKLAGLGSHTLWGKEHPGAVVAQDGVLMLVTLNVSEDLVVPDFETPIPSFSAATKKMADEAILGMKDDFDAKVDLVSVQRLHTHQVVAAKIEGVEVPVLRDRSREEIPDINEALKQMVADKKTTKPDPKKKPAPKKPAAPRKKAVS